MNDDIVESIEIEFDQREARKILDCIHAAIDRGDKDPILEEFAYKLDSEICKFGTDTEYDDTPELKIV